MTIPHRRTPRRAGRVLPVIVNSLLLVATVAGLAYLTPSLLGYERYVITGGSMSGTIEKGAIAFEKATPVADLAVGDVITYQPPADSGVTNLVTHRIIDIGRSESGARLFRTQGDANPQPDPWSFSLTAPDQPVVEFHVPHVGWALVALADRDVRLIVIGVPAGLIALASGVQLIGALRSGGRRERAEAPAQPITPVVPVAIPIPAPVHS